MYSSEHLQALLAVLTDFPTERFDAIFLHVRSHGDDDQIFQVAQGLHALAGGVPFILFTGTDGQRLGGTKPFEAWPGKAVYTKKLEELGIVEVQHTKAAYHTRQENDSFLERAIQLNWKSAVILNGGIQLLRSFLGQIKVMQEQNYWMRIYAQCPRPYDLHKIVSPSQGGQPTRRMQQVETEMNNISKYQARGDIASFSDLFDYMKRRQTIK